MVLLLLTPTPSQCQEEEDKPHMPTMDQEKNLTHSLKELIITTTIMTKKILEKETLMRKYMVLLLLTLTSSQCQEGEDKPLMLIMDQTQNLTHWLKLKKIRKILVKVTLMKKFMV